MSVIRAGAAGASPVGPPPSGPALIQDNLTTVIGTGGTLVDVPLSVNSTADNFVLFISAVSSGTFFVTGYSDNLGDSTGYTQFDVTFSDFGRCVVLYKNAAPAGVNSMQFTWSGGWSASIPRYGFAAEVENVTNTYINGICNRYNPAAFFTRGPPNAITTPGPSYAIGYGQIDDNTTFLPVFAEPEWARFDGPPRAGATKFGFAAQASFAAALTDYEGEWTPSNFDSNRRYQACMIAMD